MDASLWYVSGWTRGRCFFGRGVIPVANGGEGFPVTETLGGLFLCVCESVARVVIFAWLFTSVYVLGLVFAWW